MNRLRDHWPRTGRPHFSVKATGRGRTTVPESPRLKAPSTPIAGFDDTEADHKADMWRSLKPTLAVFAILTTIYTTFLWLAWIVTKI